MGESDGARKHKDAPTYTYRQTHADMDMEQSTVATDMSTYVALSTLYSLFYIPSSLFSTLYYLLSILPLPLSMFYFVFFTL